MKYHARLKKLEDRPGSCPKCAAVHARRVPITAIKADDLAAYERASPPVIPSRCPRCGRELPRVLEILFVIPAGHDSEPQTCRRRTSEQESTA